MSSSSSCFTNTTFVPSTPHQLSPPPISVRHNGVLPPFFSTHSHISARHLAISPNLTVSPPPFPQTKQSE
ncbi:hypothetical protein L195_g036222 [Trifolium pratense]|uniref:Uncharacterized protein n=1 Tax=Trifolium pratense TaxID=57577 RepID=A0A2K3LNV7_TRIPR|nr:hypothetical protein L195_g036222 [Trifolium pratense]